MKKKGYISIEVILVGVAVLVAAGVIAYSISSTTTDTLNGIGNSVNNIVGL